jgi:predicted enzyme related to lactoylglutathione lyase
MMVLRRVVAILPVVDIERARGFYEHALGLREIERHESSGETVYEAPGGGGTIELVPRHEPSRAEHTAVSFEVDDVQVAVLELEDRGVVFDDYDLPGLHTDGHIAEIDGQRCAWFHDPEGNILCLHENMMRVT